METTQYGSYNSVDVASMRLRAQTKELEFRPLGTCVWMFDKVRKIKYPCDGASCQSWDLRLRDCGLKFQSYISIAR